MKKQIRPVFIHLNVLWEKNKDEMFPDYYVTPYMFNNRDSYLHYFNSLLRSPEIKEDFQKDIETIEYWTEFYKNSSIDDMLNNNNSWIMFNVEDFSIYDGYHRLTAAKLAKKEIIVATLDVGEWIQGKPI